MAEWINIIRNNSFVNQMIASVVYKFWNYTSSEIGYDSSQIGWQVDGKFRIFKIFYRSKFCNFSLHLQH